MNKISKEKLTALTDGATPPSVTIYMPTHKAPNPPNMSEDQTRFKNLISKALEQLGTADSGKEFAAVFSKQADEWMEDINFWEQQTESLLICARPETMQYFNLPIDSDEYVAVDNHFHLAPLLGLTDELETFYVLAVKQKQPFLLKGDAYGLEPSGLELPASIEEALNIDEMFQRSVQFSAIKGGAGAEFHGHGGVKDAGAEERSQFLRILHDKVVHFVDKKSPIIIAGTSDEVAEFIHYCKMDNVLRDYIHGSFLDTQVNELHRHAMALIGKHVIAPMQQQVREQYERLAGRNPDRVEDSVAGIKDAAEKGKVETLLLGILNYTADTIRDNTNRVVKLTFPPERSRQALDYLAQQVWNQGGRIINMYSQQMPEPMPVLAINRY